MESNSLFWSLVVIQAFGLLSVAGARAFERTSLASPFKAGVFVFLSLLGIGMVAAIQRGQFCWLPCGATLSMMSLGATIDFRGISPSAF